jgi:hypothetical protein
MDDSVIVGPMRRAAGSYRLDVESENLQMLDAQGRVLRSYRIGIQPGEIGDVRRDGSNLYLARTSMPEGGLVLVRSSIEAAVQPPERRPSG